MALLIPDYLQSTPATANATRFAFSDLRLQRGVSNPSTWAPTPLKVTQRSTPAMAVDIAVGTAWVRGQSALNGLYHIVSDAIETRAIAANPSSDPRVDTVVAHVYDSQDTADLTDGWDVEVLPGTPSPSANLESYAGAAVDSDGAAAQGMIILGMVLVAPGASSITNAEIRDRRAWAQGGFFMNRLTSDHVVASGAGTDTPTDWRVRMERASGRLMMHVVGSVEMASSTTGQVTFRPYVNAALTASARIAHNRVASVRKFPLNLYWELDTSAGNGIVGVDMVTQNAGATIKAGSTVVIREMLRPYRQNGQL